jgi:multidrug efflux system membrane fusion protein
MIPRFLFRTLLAAPVLVLAAGCRPPAASHSPVPPVGVAIAQQDDTAQQNQSRYTGSVTANRQVDVAFQEGGYIEQILQVPGQDGRRRLVQEGDTVAAGATLAQIRASDYTARVQQAQAQQAQAQAAVAQAQGGQAQAQATLELAQAAVREARAGQEASAAQVAEAQAASKQADQQIEAARIATQAAQQQRNEAQAAVGQAQAGVDEAQAALTRAHQDFDRADALFKTESLTKTDYDAARAAYEGAQAKRQEAVTQVRQAQAKVQEATAQIQSAQNRIAQAQTQRTAAETRITQAQAQDKARSSQISQAQARVASAQSGVRTAAAQLQSAQAGERSANAQLAGARVPLGNTAVTAPISGIVLARQVEIGTLVGPGTVAFRLADVSRMKVVFGVPDTQVTILRKGQQTPIRVDVLPQTPLLGTITNIAPSADPRTRVFNVEVTVANPEQRLKVGMVATLDLPDGGRGAHTPRGGVSVPVAALIHAPGSAAGYAVMVVMKEGEKTVAHLRTVQVGVIAGNQVAVQGVQAGEQVVTTGVNLVRDGEAVRITGTTEEGDLGTQE